jgi:hypothetical protein
MNKLDFCSRFLYLDGEPMSFAGRPYLPAIYGADRGNLVVCASRQVEKSTYLANTILHAACANPAAKILFVAPRLEQVRTFSHDRLHPLLKDSPMIERALLGPGHRLRVTDMDFSNGARVYLRPAFSSADACRGLSANLLLVDEVQDVAAGDLPVLQETLSHATNPRTILTGTPKLVDNHLEAMFARSTANRWTIPCRNCGAGVTIDERCLGPTGLICPACQSDLDVKEGTWVAQNPHSKWGQGFSISHPMVPWFQSKYPEILERQRSYDQVQFRNEVLGLPSALGDHVVTRPELEACCGTSPMLQHGDYEGLGRRIPLYAGIDWGGGANSRTILVIGRMHQNFVFEILQIVALPVREDPDAVLESIANCCNYYQVSVIAADGNGNGHVYNRLLWQKVQPRGGFYTIYYSGNEQEPTADGVLNRWTVNRSRSIGALFGRVKRKSLIFPCRKYADIYLDEFACEFAVYDDEQRMIKYDHPPSQFDDTLHATNYALLIATRAHPLDSDQSLPFEPVLLH